MADPFIAEIRIFPFNFAPRGWASCDGQVLPISQNTALFALLGVTYGGDGKSTFGLPDLRGNAPMHPGQGPGLSARTLGEEGGNEAVTVPTSEMPGHGHRMRGAAQDPALAKAVNPDASWSLTQGGGVYQTSADAQLAAEAVGPAGGSAPHNNMQPYLTLAFTIALQGIFPPRG
jgi:microcystin-dependent protein